MGMPVAIEVRDAPDIAPGAIERAFAWLEWVDRTFSTYRPESEISRLNAGTLARDRAHPLVREVLDRCAALRVETGGAFDAAAPRPGELDPTGLVKGWAVDRAVALLQGAGAGKLCVNAGGDVAVRGGPWRVGIRHPHRSDRLAAVLRITDGAVATSGAYERGAHIVDPRTGRPPHGVVAVTVVGRDLATADAYATAAFALGEDGPAWTATIDPYQAMTVLAGDRVLSTPGISALRAAMREVQVADAQLAPARDRHAPRGASRRTDRRTRRTRWPAPGAASRA
jgi:thiamine biosynthesis lipoprotein